MHLKSKQRRQKEWDDGVAPGVKVDLVLYKKEMQFSAAVKQHISYAKPNICLFHGTMIDKPDVKRAILKPFPWVEWLCLDKQDLIIPESS